MPRQYDSEFDRVLEELGGEAHGNATTGTAAPATKAESAPTAARRAGAPEAGGKPARAAAAAWAALGVRPGEVLGGRYRLIDVIGRGGMGAVFAGVDRVDERAVAVKVLRAEVAGDERQAERFRREARAGREVQHPNVVAILDHGVDEGRPFIVMERLEGVTLGRLIRERAPLEVERAVAIVSAALRGLEAAHALGIVHRDIKPDNIFVARDHAGRGSVKLLDFGLAHLDRPELARLTTKSRRIGTLSYMAPEQLRAATAAGAASDQYAAAVVLYQALTGRLPHEAETEADLILKKATEATTDIRRHRSDLPTALAAAIMQALAPKPTERHADVAAFRRALKRA